MTRTELVLAAMCAGGSPSFSPVQIQKLFFLIDQNISSQVNGPHFDFQPKDYGPFDKQVYECVESLARCGEVEIEDGRYKRFRVTSEGKEKGDSILKSLSTPLQTYLTDLSKWIRSLSFQDLVSAIYKDYPEMKINSVFRSES